VEIPETGLSLGEIQHLLEQRFGHDQRIEGDLVEIDPNQLILTVRGTRILPARLAGWVGNLHELLVQAAEYVFGQSQPGVYTAYLANNNRSEEAIRFAQSEFVKASVSERPYLLNYWGVALNDVPSKEAPAEALRLYRLALRMKPDYWVARHNAMVALYSMGREEEVVREGAQMLKVAGGRPGRAPEDEYELWDYMRWDLPALAAEQNADVAATAGGSTSRAAGAENLAIALIEAQMHSPDAALVRLKATPVDKSVLPDVAAAAYAEAVIAEETGDLPAAGRAWDAYAATYSDPTVANNDPASMCFAAPTYEKLGDSSKADAALNAPGNLTFVDCYRFHGDVLDMRGDWASAKSWYAKAIALGPSLPAGYFSLGLALARHGDLPGAAEYLAIAHEKGPHWADPLEAWGDVLVRQGKKREAREKFRSAQKFAPEWRLLQKEIDAISG